MVCDFFSASPIDLQVRKQAVTLKHRQEGYRSADVYYCDACSHRYSTALAGFSDNVEYVVYK